MTFARHLRLYLLSALASLSLFLALAPASMAQEPASPEQLEAGTEAPGGTEIPIVQSSTDRIDDLATVDWGEELAKGGWVAIVLILLIVAAVAFVVERFITVRRKAFLPSNLEEQVRKKWQAGDLDGAAREAKGNSSAYGRVVRYLSRHAHFPYSVVSVTAADIGAREQQAQMRRSYPLLVIATISPLLGLLGTIIGMIEAFQKVALLGDTGDAAVLADSIGKALITTALGLIIAIPTLAFYHYFRSRISGFATALEEAIEELLGTHVQYLMNREKEEAAETNPEPRPETDPSSPQAQ